VTTPAGAPRALKGLTRIQSAQDRDEAQGLKKSRAVPRCLIEYDGGTIDPTDPIDGDRDLLQSM